MRLRTASPLARHLGLSLSLVILLAATHIVAQVADDARRNRDIGPSQPLSTILHLAQCNHLPLGIALGRNNSLCTTSAETDLTRMSVPQAVQALSARAGYTFAMHNGSGGV